MANINEQPRAAQKTDVLTRTPEQRTKELFAKGHIELAQELTGVIIQVVGTNQSFRITEVSPWSREANEKRQIYSSVTTAQPGTVIGIPRAVRGFPLTLVGAIDQDKKTPGACVQIKRAESCSDETQATGKAVKGRQTMIQTDIARAIGITEETQGQVFGTLSYQDESDILYFELKPVVPEQPNQPKNAATGSRRGRSGGEVDAAEASEVLGKLFEFEE